MKLLVNIDVPDIEAAAAFYQAALDLKLNRVLDGDVAELSGASSVIYLLQNPPGSAANPATAAPRDYGRHWTPVHLDFVVGDVLEAAQRAIAAGAKQEGECVNWLGSKHITFSDPFGHGFCLIEFAGEGYQDSGDSN